MTMKFNKPKITFTQEEKKKIGMMAILVVVVIVVVNMQLLSPLATQKTHARAGIAELQKKLTAAKNQIRETKRLEGKYSEVKSELDTLLSITKPGAPEAWEPPLIQEYFRKRGLEVEGVHFIKADHNAPIAGYERTDLVVEIPKASPFKLGETIAEIENTLPIIDFNSIVVTAIKDQGDTQDVVMEFGMAIRDVPVIISAAEPAK